MAKLKKALAVVLAAATAFTFAPVANLGNAVQAEAATAGKLVDLADTDKEIDLTVGGSTYVPFKDLAKNIPDSNYGTVKVHVVKDTYAKVIFGDKLNKTKTYADGNTDLTSTNLPAEGQASGEGGIQILAGTTSGDTTIEITSHNAVDNKTIKDVLTVHVGASVKYFDAIRDLTFVKTGKDTYLKDDLSGAPAAADLQLNASVANSSDLDTAANYDVTVAGSNDSVATASFAKSGTGANDLAKTTAGKVTVVLHDAGTATFTLALKQTKGGKTTPVATGKFTVTVKNYADTLSVSYDGNRDGKNEKYEVSAYVGEQASATSVTNTFKKNNVYGVETTYYQDGDNTSAMTASQDLKVRAIAASTAIYLDTVTNKTSKISADDTLKRFISFESDSPYFSVDNSGNISVSDKYELGRTGTVSGYITVSVAEKPDGSKSTAALKIYVPVTAYDKEAEALTVSKDNGEVIGQAVGTTNVDSNATYTDLPVVYLSTKDKKTLHINIKSGSGLGYVQGVVNNVNTDDTLGSQSTDVVTYDNATQTLTAGEKAGKAYVTIVARNDTAHYGNAIVKFAVEVVTKSANNVITAPAKITLSRSKNTQSIGATTTFATPLSYDLVKEVGSSETVKSSDISVDGTGKVTYLSANSGSVVVRIQGEDTADAVVPDAAYVTVEYSSTLDPSTLQVTSDKKLNLKVGETSKVVASGTAITYSSSDDSVASVAADGTITAKNFGAAVITVSSPADASHMEGNEYITVIVSQNGDIDTVTKPTKVTGVKVKNKKGGYVTVSWTKQSQKNVKYYVKKTVGKKSAGKSVNGGKTTLQVKKGATVKVKVKAYVYNAAGDKLVGSYSKTVTLKTDKK